MGRGPFLVVATLEGLVSAAALALTALGLSLGFGDMRIANVAHGEFYMLGAAFARFVAAPRCLASPRWASPPRSSLAPLAVGAHRPRRRPPGPEAPRLHPEATIVATIGLALHPAAARPHPLWPRRPAGAGAYQFSALNSRSGYPGYKLIVIGAAIAAAPRHLADPDADKGLGLVMRATQYDRETAQAFGIPVNRVYAAVFAMGAMLAAVAGVLIVPIRHADHLMGLDPLLPSFIVVIIGGLGSGAARWSRRS